MDVVLLQPAGEQEERTEILGGRIPEKVKRQG